jgi:hypothetical protein
MASKATSLTSTLAAPGWSGCGISKWPRSSRLYQRMTPVPSHDRTLTVCLRRPKKTKSALERGSRRIRSTDECPKSLEPESHVDRLHRHEDLHTLRDHALSGPDSAPTTSRRSARSKPRRTTTRAPPTSTASSATAVATTSRRTKPPPGPAGGATCSDAHRSKLPEENPRAAANFAALWPLPRHASTSRRLSRSLRRRPMCPAWHPRIPRWRWGRCNVTVHVRTWEIPLVAESEIATGAAPKRRAGARRSSRQGDGRSGAARPRGRRSG